jgi:hypothetical protein
MEEKNRKGRRARERGQDPGRQQPPRPQQEQEQQIDPPAPPDVTSARAKGSRHGKSTADKWNQ